MPVATVTAGTGIGQPVRRKEDLRLVTGKGSYTDDVNLPGQAYAVMVRSPHAHARIRAIDIAPAMTIPGVLAVLTGRDLVADGLQPIPHKVWSQHPAEIMLREHNGFKTLTAPHYALPPDKVRFAGEAVAMVIATTVAAAKDGAELVEIDYEALPAVTDTLEAAQPDAPRLFEETQSNVVVDGELGDRAATEAAVNVTFCVPVPSLPEITQTSLKAPAVAELNVTLSVMVEPAEMTEPSERIVVATNGPSAGGLDFVIVRSVPPTFLI